MGRPRGNPNFKKAKPAQAREPEPEEPDTPGDPGEDEEEDYLPWEEDLRQWDLEERQADEISRFTLFRRSASNKGNEKVFEWIGEIPSSHEIGLRFGGGMYTAYLLLPRIRGEKNNRFRSRRFTLAETYTMEKRKADIEAGIAPPGMYGGHQVQQAQQANPLEMVASIIERIVIPLMGSRPAQSTDQFAQFKGFSDAMIEVTANAARSQIQLTREIQKELTLGRPTKEESEEPPEGEFKEFLKDVLKEYGPMIVEAGALKMKSIASQLKKDEVFQALSGDQNLFTRVLGLLARDPEIDQGVASKVLDKLSRMNIGIKVPLGVLTHPAAPAVPASTTGAPQS